jgi:hypothetical protein
LPADPRRLGGLHRMAELGKTVRQPPRRRRRRRRDDERELGVGDRGKTVGATDDAVIGEDRDVGQDAGAEAG